MNKKFSTLFAVALLSSAFSANAAVGGNVTKINSDYLYQLQVVKQGSTDVSAQDLVLGVDKDGDLSVQSAAAATTGKVLGNTLWCASVTQSQDYGQNPIFDFTNKANGYVLDLTVGGYDTWANGTNGLPTKLHVQVGGEVSGWEFSPNVSPLTGECYLASYISGNKAAVLVWDDYDVAVSIVDAATLRKTPDAINNLMRFTLVQPVCIDLAQEDFNTILQTREKEAEVKLTFDKKQNDQNEIIEEVYFPSYMLDGFELSNEVSTPIMVLYEFVNDSDELISFEQLVVEGSNFLLDNEKGDTTIIEVDDYKVYHRYTDKQHHYIWNDGKYAMTLNSSFSISNEELKNIIYGMKIKE